jgi:hypothetical protein
MSELPPVALALTGPVPIAKNVVGREPRENRQAVRDCFHTKQNWALLSCQVFGLGELFLELVCDLFRFCYDL